LQIADTLANAKIYNTFALADPIKKMNEDGKRF